MADVHDRIHKHRQKLKAGETKQADPVPPVAASLVEEARCSVSRRARDGYRRCDDPLAPVRRALQRGCILVTTSNVEPDNLYKDGLNRGLFLPFVDLLKQYVEIVPLDLLTDYRLEKGQRPAGLPLSADAGSRHGDGCGLAARGGGQAGGCRDDRLPWPQHNGAAGVSPGGALFLRRSLPASAGGRRLTSESCRATTRCSSTTSPCSAPISATRPSASSIRGHGS